VWFHTVVESVDERFVTLFPSVDFHQSSTSEFFLPQYTEKALHILRTRYRYFTDCVFLPSLALHEKLLSCVFSVLEEEVEVTDDIDELNLELEQSSVFY